VKQKPPIVDPGKLVFEDQPAGVFASGFQKCSQVLCFHAFPGAGVVPLRRFGSPADLLRRPLREMHGTKLPENNKENKKMSTEK
jgi:hypothetical protein